MKYAKTTKRATFSAEMNQVTCQNPFDGYVDHQVRMSCADGMWISIEVHRCPSAHAAHRKPRAQRRQRHLGLGVGGALAEQFVRWHLHQPKRLLEAAREPTLAARPGSLERRLGRQLAFGSRVFEY